MHPIVWIKRSLSRQIMVLMVLLGCTVTSVYAFIDYKREIAQLHEILDTQAEYLTRTLTLVIADDVRYRKYYELWNKLNEIYRYNTDSIVRDNLYRIRTIVVIDERAQVLAHTQPKEYPLGLPYKHALYPKLAEIAVSDSGFGQRLNSKDNTLILYMPVQFGGEVLGTVIVDFDTFALTVVRNRLVLTYLVYIIVLVVSVLGLSLILARMLAKPVQDAVGSLPALGEGHIKLPSLLRRSDELYWLGAAIQQADKRIYDDTQELHDQQSKIRMLNIGLERRISERTGELERANKELEAFSYSVSHDLRSPLRSISGFADALTEDCNEMLDDEGRRYLERIQSATNRMAQIIDDLLMLSRVGRQEIQTGDVNISELAATIRETLQEQESCTGIDFNVADGLHSYGDENLLRIVFENLIGNACKYSAKQMHPRIEINCEKQDGETVFFVRDNGAGFDMRYADKLFGVFQRLHGSEFEGTGIGLATVQRIITRHGGRIWADAELNKGATFYFSLPE